MTSKAAAPIAEVESHPKDGSQTPAEILPRVWREMSWERRRPIRVKLSPTRAAREGREGRGLHALMGKPVC